MDIAEVCTKCKKRKWENGAKETMEQNEKKKNIVGTSDVLLGCVSSAHASHEVVSLGRARGGDVVLAQREGRAARHTVTRPVVLAAGNELLAGAQ